MPESVHIIGAGIGGLSLGIVLRRQGLNVRLYEAADAIRPVGAGILIASNAMQVFKSLGLDQKVAAFGNRVTTMRITDEKMRNLSVVDLTQFERRFGVHNTAIHRADLQRILAEELGMEHIFLSRRLTRIEREDDFRLHFSDGSTEHVDVLVGADGIHSQVRQQLFEASEVRDAKQLCWRGVCTHSLPLPNRHQLVEAWGRGKRFGYAQINERQVYWYAVSNAAAVPVQGREVAALFQSFHPELQCLIAMTPPEQIICNDILDLKPIAHWQQTKVCLIGDAAHATTPNLGQGACQAIEDAYVIGLGLARGLSLAEALAAFEKKRRSKALMVVKKSWQLGKLAQLQHPLLVQFRNLSMKLTPQRISRKQFEALFSLQY